jgi:hypothetical protein
MRRFAMVLSMGVIAGAASPKQPVPIDSVWSGTKCTQSVALDSFVGQIASTDLAARIMMASRAHDVRWVPYGSSVKMKPGANRVTVQLDQENKVTSANCG